MKCLLPETEKNVERGKEEYQLGQGWEAGLAQHSFTESSSLSVSIFFSNLSFKTTKTKIYSWHSAFTVTANTAHV